MSDAVQDPIARKRRHRNERLAAATLILGLVLVCVWLVRWRNTEEREFARMTAYIPRRPEITPAVNLLAEYVRIDTSTPAGSARGARWLAAQLQKGGVRAELIESAPGRLNVYARLPGRERGEGLLLFNHIDVVPPGPGWTQPPFEARIVGDQMYGRGTVDMKALAICQLLAFLEVAKSGRSPASDLAFLATADEETGSAFGMRWIVANRPDVLENIRYGITEGGVTEMMTERMTWFGIEIGGKYVTEATLRANSVEAIRETRQALEPWIGSRQPDRVLPAVRSYLREIAPTRLRFRPLLADIDATIREGKFWALPVSYRDLMQNSLWVSAPHRAGQEWALNVRMINLPDEIPAARLAWLAERVSIHGARIVSSHLGNGPSPLSPSDTPLFSLLAEEARDRYHVEAGSQILFRSTSDARFLRPLGIVCYGVSPYPVDVFQSLAIHHQDERIRIGSFNDGVDFFSQVIGRWAEDHG